MTPSDRPVRFFDSRYNFLGMLVELTCRFIGPSGIRSHSISDDAVRSPLPKHLGFRVYVATHGHIAWVLFLPASGLRPPDDARGQLGHHYPGRAESNRT